MQEAVTKDSKVCPGSATILSPTAANQPLKGECVTRVSEKATALLHRSPHSCSSCSKGRVAATLQNRDVGSSLWAKQWRKDRYPHYEKTATTADTLARAFHLLEISNLALELNKVQLTVFGLVRFLASVSQLLKWLYVLLLQRTKWAILAAAVFKSTQVPPAQSASLKHTSTCHPCSPTSWQSSSSLLRSWSK